MAYFRSRVGAAGRVRPSALWAIVVGLGLAVPAACDLNPQPEVPSGSTGGSGATTSGGSGGGMGVGGAGGGNGPGGSGGWSGGGGVDAATQGCACKTGEVCNNSGFCVADPCEPNNCAASQACKPNAEFDAADCFDSCASVSCPSGKVCENGSCVPTGCGGDCAAGEVCAPLADGGYACVPDACDADAAASCGVGLVCDPVSGGCVPDPCNGVKCPTGQECRSGECQWLDDSGASAADSGSD